MNLKCHSERSEDELLRARPKNLKSISLCIQILRIAQDDNIGHFFFFSLNRSANAQ